MSTDKAKGKRNKKKSSDILEIVRDFLELKLDNLRDPEISDIEFKERVSNDLTGSKDGYYTRYSEVVDYIYEKPKDLGCGLKRVESAFILWDLALIGHKAVNKPKIYTETVHRFMDLDVSEYVHFIMALPTWNKEWYVGDTDDLLKSFETELDKGYDIKNLLNYAILHALFFTCDLGYDKKCIRILNILDDMAKQVIPDVYKEELESYAIACRYTTMVWILMVYGPMAIMKHLENEKDE